VVVIDGEGDYFAAYLGVLGFPAYSAAAVLFAEHLVVTVDGDAVQPLKLRAFMILRIESAHLTRILPHISRVLRAFCAGNNRLFPVKVTNTPRLAAVRTLACHPPLGLFGRVGGKGPEIDCPCCWDNVPMIAAKAAPRFVLGMFFFSAPVCWARLLGCPVASYTFAMSIA